MRIAGINLPDNKRADIGLSYLYGVGRSTGQVILRSANVDLDKKIKDLTQDEVIRIQNIIEQNYTIEGDLRRAIGDNIKRLKEISTWKGSRHSRRLPLHGRSKTNSRTLRGNVRKTMGSGRRKSDAKT